MRTAAWLVGVLLWLMSCVAWADDDAAAAQFTEARRLYNDAQYAVALPLFETALASSGSPNARIFVARCLRELGRLTESYEQMRVTLNESRQLAKDSPKYVPTRDASAAELAKLDQLVGRVVVALSSPVDGATLSVGMTEVAVGHEPVPVTPGEVIVQAHAAAHESAEKKVNVAAGELKTVVLELLPVSANTPPVVAQTGADDAGLGTVRAVGIGVASLGAAGLIAAAITGVMAQSRADQLEEECGGQRCVEARYAETVDEGETLKLVTNIALGAGGALAVAGAVMIIFGGPGDPGDSALLVSPAPGADIGFGIGGRF